MLAVIFEVHPTEEGKADYFATAAGLRSFLEGRPGFVSIERFQSLVDEGKILSLSFWENEAAIQDWRNLFEHRMAQKAGKETLFRDYRIRVAEVIRDYSGTRREQAPADSNAHLMRG